MKFEMTADVARMVAERIIEATDVNVVTVNKVTLFADQEHGTSDEVEVRIECDSVALIGGNGNE